MAVVKLEAFRALEAAIKAEIPDTLEVVLVQRKPGATECMPNVVITPVRFNYFPDQEEDRFVPDPSHLVLNVGRHEGIVQLRLAASSLAELAEYEERILNVFLATEGHPGVLLTPVTACPTLGQFVAAWELEDDEWDLAKTFDKRFEAVVVLTGIVPALVTRAGEYETKHLEIGLTSDFKTQFDATTIAQTDLVEITADGSIIAPT